MTKDLCFEITDANGVLLWVNDSVIIPFNSVEEFTKFAEGMLHMVPEITDTLKNS